MRRVRWTILLAVAALPLTLFSPAGAAAPKKPPGTLAWNDAARTVTWTTAPKKHPANWELFVNTADTLPTQEVGSAYGDSGSTLTVDYPTTPWCGYLEATVFKNGHRRPLIDQAHQVPC